MAHFVFHQMHNATVPQSGTMFKCIFFENCHPQWPKTNHKSPSNGSLKKIVPPNDKSLLSNIQMKTNDDSHQLRIFADAPLRGIEIPLFESLLFTPNDLMKNLWKRNGGIGTNWISFASMIINFLCQKCLIDGQRVGGRCGGIDQFIGMKNVIYRRRKNLLSLIYFLFPWMTR